MSNGITRREFLYKSIGAITAAALLPGVLSSKALGAESNVLQIPDFSFIHISDEHVFIKGTKETIAELSKLGEVLLKPYDIKSTVPSFIVETGDMTEFGPKGGAWEALNGYYSSVPLPRYRALGNHDETWGALSFEMRDLYGAPYYSVDKFNCHFVILNSSGLQDPRPVISPEELEWLKGDLRNVSSDTPLFVALHHPLDCGEYSSAYETDRLLDLIRPYNVVAVLVGHTHTNEHKLYKGVDMVYGGSTWGPCPPGFQICTVQDGILSIAYKERDVKEATWPMVRKSVLPPAVRYPKINISSPVERTVFKSSISVKASIESDKIKSAYYEIDSLAKTALVLDSGSSFKGTINTEKLMLGAHSIRVTFIGEKAHRYERSTCFYVDSDSPKVHWRNYLKAASKSTPALTEMSVYVGSNDCSLRSFDRDTGASRWAFRTGGAVACEPLVIGDKIYFGCEDKNLYCLSVADGSLVWKFTAEAPVYSSPVSDGNSVYFGCRSGAFYSVNAVAGSQNWVSRSADYSVECKPCIADGRVFYGAWDGNLHCLNTADGEVIWKVLSKGSSDKNGSAYYSPADCGPIVAGGKLFAADRKYSLSIMDAANGKLISSMENISGAGLSADSKFVYLRKTDKALTKIDLNGKQVWSANVSMDAEPVAPREVDGVVYVCSQRGLVSAVSAKNAKVLWQYQATPQSFVLCSVSATNGIAYISGTDGSLTAVGL